ncbi:MAG: PAS domain S-box protein [Thermoproteota archaeon]
MAKPRIGVLREKLRQCEKKFNSLFEASLDAIFLVDAKTGEIIDCNQAAIELVGREKEELIGKLQKILIKSGMEEEFSRTFEQHLKKGSSETFESQVITKNGEIREAIAGANRLELGDSTIIQAVFRDVTEQKRIEESLKEWKGRYKELINWMNDTVWVIDLEGNFVDVNDAAVEVLGYSREELLSMGPTDIDSSLDPEEIRELIKNMPADEIQVFETTHITKQGEEIPVEISSSLITYKGKPAILSIARDITSRKQKEKELKKKSEELKRLNEKLEIVGKMARHDVRNKLSTVATNLYLAKRQLGDQHEVADYLEDIKTAVDQATKIFDFAKAYEQLGTEKLEYLDVGEAVEDALQHISDLKGIELENRCKGLTVLADPMLPRLFYNLIHNSLQHGGEELSQIIIYCQSEESNEVKVVYEDDGVGISEEEKEKIFQEGYGKGTGYGLHLIREMCEVYGWTIKESGQPEQGVKFTITIPQKAI